MADRNQLDGMEGDVRFHHLTPELWVLEARRCAHRWVVFHETYSFCLVEKVVDGALVDWKYNHRLYVADPAHAMLMQPGELHANLERTPPADFIVVQVAERLVKAVAATLGWPHPGLNINHPNPASGHPAVLAALRGFRRSLCADLYDPRPGRGLCTCSREPDRHLENLTHLIATVIEHCAEQTRAIIHPGRGAAPITKAIRHMQRHYREPYDLRRVAAVAGCAPHYLVHLFSSELGIPPSVYKNRILVAKTCEALVAAPRKPLQLIAEEVGWPGRARGRDADRSNLVIRHFRRAMGTTPDEFRSSVRKAVRADRHA
jgi:AraC-like DNA-binding protein